MRKTTQDIATIAKKGYGETSKLIKGEKMTKLGIIKDLMNIVTCALFGHEWVVRHRNEKNYIQYKMCERCYKSKVWDKRSRKWKVM